VERDPSDVVAHSGSHVAQLQLQLQNDNHWIWKETHKTYRKVLVAFIKVERMRGFCNYVKDESVVKWLVLMYAPRTELEKYFGTAANVDFLKRLLTSFVTKADFGRLEALVQATPEECQTRFF